MRLFRRPLASHVAAVRVSAAAALIATSLLFIPMHHPAPLLADEEPPVFVELWGSRTARALRWASSTT